MNAGRPPPILSHHAVDQLAECMVDTWASLFAGDASPVHTERSSVPGTAVGSVVCAVRRLPLVVSPQILWIWCSRLDVPDVTPTAAYPCRQPISSPTVTTPHAD